MKKIRMYFVPVLVISLASFICSCSSKSPDTTAPTVVSTTPANGATAVQISDSMLVVFSEDMDATTITNARFILASATATVSTSVSYDETLKTATIHHAGVLDYSTAYTVTISGQVTDASGNAMGSDYSFSFTTAAVLLGTLSWSNPLPQGNTLNGAWTFSDNDTFVVGNVGTIVHSDGTAWTVMDSHTNVNLMAIWGASSDDVYAVGQSGIMMHYDGSAWSLAHIESEGSTLYSIWGTSASDIFAGSDTGIIHWNGSEWSAMTLPEETRVLSIWGFADDDVYATDSINRLLKYDGQSWSVFEDFYGIILGTVWGTSASNLYTGGLSPFTMNGTFHYDGSTWSTVEDITWALNGMWGSATDNIYGVGPSGYMVHYDGTEWSDVSRHYVGYHFANGTSASNIYAVGDYGLIEHNDGTDWEIQNGIYIWTLYDALGFAADNIYAVGVAGNILHYDGTSWERLDPLVESRDNFGIAGTSPNNIYVVNCLDDTQSFDGGDIFQYDGANWNAVVEDPLTCFKSVWVSDDGEVFAVGYNDSEDGWYYHYDGADWQNEALTSITRTTAVSGSSKDNVIAVGANGTAMIYDGSSWHTMNTGTNATINSVIVFSDTEAYAVDANGLLLSYDGNSGFTWTVVARVSTRSLTNIWGTSGEDLFMIANVYSTENVGGNDLLIHYDGTSFSQVESIADKNLIGAWGLSGNDIYFVGVYGVILHYVK